MAIKIGGNGVFLLQTLTASYAMGIDERGLLRHLYWGKRLESADEFDLPQINEISTNDPAIDITKEEFPVYGGLRYKEYCLKVTFADGVRECVYRYEGYKMKSENDHDELIITLRDTHYGLIIELSYKVYEAYDIMERTVTLKNCGGEKIGIERIHSAQFHIPGEELTFSNVHGHWGAEQQRFTQKAGYGKILFECRRGISTHNHNPYFILDSGADEQTGEVYYGALKLSGNFSGIIERPPYGGTSAQLGINDHDFALDLLPGEDFCAPSVIFGYSDQGYEKMTQNLHRFAREKIMHGGLRPVLYNSWEATGFSVTVQEQMKLAEKAKEIGAELFVVDDGWFGQRNGTDNGLGDWYVNREKFPNGLEELIDRVKGLGMLFGIWVEPEMVNPKSALFLEHPDWIYHYDTRTSDTSRDQYVLNLTREDVRDFVFDTLDGLLSAYDIDYIKWDANRPISQPSVKKDIWYRHIEALYGIVKELKAKHPGVLFEACASGGGRIDYGALSCFDDFWTSDNTDAYDRLYIQDSYSYIYPIKAMRAWVTDCPNFITQRSIPLTFRFHSAMLGSLGIGCNILKFTEEEKKTAREMIDLYKEIRPIVQEGEFYRLSHGDYFVYEYLSGGDGLLFVFLPQSKVGCRDVRIKLRGLCDEAVYTLSTGQKKSGAYLKNHGIELRLTGDYASEIIRIKKV